MHISNAEYRRQRKRYGMVVLTILDMSAGLCRAFLDSRLIHERDGENLVANVVTCHDGYACGWARHDDWALFATDALWYRFGNKWEACLVHGCEMYHEMSLQTIVSVQCLDERGGWRFPLVLRASPVRRLNRSRSWLYTMYWFWPLEGGA